MAVFSRKDVVTMRNVIRWLQLIGYALITLLMGAAAVSSFAALGTSEWGIVAGLYVVLAVFAAVLVFLKFKHIKGSVLCGVICAAVELLASVPLIATSIFALIGTGDFAYLGEIIGAIIGIIIIIYAVPV